MNPVQKGYEVLGWLSTDEVKLDDMNLIDQVNPLRVKTMGVRLTGKPCLRVRVISLSEPCMMNENILFTARKRSRWFDYGGGSK